MPWRDWSEHVFTLVMLETHKNPKTLVLNDGEPQIIPLYNKHPLMRVLPSWSDDITWAQSRDGPTYGVLFV